jgi:hypothetical protein
LKAYFIEGGIKREMGDFESIEAIDSRLAQTIDAERITEYLIDQDFGLDKVASYKNTDGVFLVGFVK